MTSAVCSNNFVDNPATVVQLNQVREAKYNKEAVYYALPKAFILNVLPLLSGSATKVFLNLVYHTDPFNRIKYPQHITYKSIMKMTGIKKRDTVSKAFKELAELHVIGGYTPGSGSENTKFYFTFDIDHYKTEKSCLNIQEIDSYYTMITNKNDCNSVSDTIPNNDNSENETDSMNVNQESLENKLQDGHEKGEGTPKKRTPFNTINSSINNINSMQTEKSNYDLNSLNKTLIELAKQSSSFTKQFNDFCVRDDFNYRKNTFFWIIKHAGDNKLSLDDVISSLEAANNKGRYGKMCYLIGIMKNKSGNKKAGISAVGKPVYIQAIEYFESRFRYCIDYLKSYNFDFSKQKITYTLKDQSDSLTLREFFCYVTQDIKQHVGVSLDAVEV